MLGDASSQQQAKLVLLGDMGAGKSSLVLRFVKGQFYDYQGAAAAVIVYDISNADSFQKAKNWVKELQRQGSPNLIMALAGNKADLAESRAVPAEEAQAYADENGLQFWETSAKTNVNVNELFVDLAKRLPRAEVPRPATGGITLTEPAPERPKKANCC